MDSNQQRFIEDALDLLNDLDEGLLQLEANPMATAPLEQVFRTMHTIKGGANMFGFEHIGELAHHLETLFDLVREGKLKVSDPLISLTLQAFDKVRALLSEKDFAKINNADALKEHIKSAIDFLKTFEREFSHLHQDNTGIALVKDELATFFIRVTPTIKITESGQHPLIFIIQDIEALGSSKTYLFTKENGEVAAWNMILATTVSLSELESYFIFVETECLFEFSKLATFDLLENENFLHWTNEEKAQQLELSELQAFAEKAAAESGNKLFQEDDEDSDSQDNFRKKSINDSYIKVSKHKVDDLLNWIGELIILQAQLSTTASSIENTTLTDVAERLEMITGQLRDTSLEIGLVPVETLVTKFKRLVRDLSKQLNKKVNFISEGTDTEMDKDVIELMAEPMIHIIRNSIDHGIESPDERKASGKSEHGTVKLKTFNSSSCVNLIISDDGKGINKQKVLDKAIEKGLIKSSDELSDDEIYEFIFHPGLSTAAKISDVSGRGVGMDVVKQKINELRGSVSVKSLPGKGTSMHIKLPLSRSIIEGLLVNVSDTRYIIPLNIVERIDRIEYRELDFQEKLNKMVVVNEELLEIFSLRKEFHDESNPPKTTDIISIQINGIRKGIAVDRIEGKMQVVMKPLGDAYKQQDFISGSTVLGNGSMALVIDPARLFLLKKNNLLI